MYVSDKDLRTLSELAYIDLDEYIGVKAPINSLGNGKVINELKVRLKKHCSSLREEDVDTILSKWELVHSVQHFVKNAPQKIPNNSLLDAFTFRHLIHKEQIVIAFRGSNPDDKSQWEEDMKVNLELIFTNEIKNQTRFSQIDLAFNFVLLNLIQAGFPNCNCCNHNHLIPIEGYDTSQLCDHSNIIYLTGHSKGGGIVQQVTYLLETLYKLRVNSVTFSATPIEGLSIVVQELIKVGALNKDFDTHSILCKNYTIKRDRVLFGLRLIRFKSFYALINNERKKHNTESSEKIPIIKLVKLPFVWKREYVGEQVILKPFRPFCIKSPIVRIKKHSLSFFDRCFSEDDNIPTK